MHKLFELRDKLMDELEEQTGRQLTEQSLGLIDKLTHSIKSIDTIIAMNIEEHGESRDGYSGRRGYFYTQRDGGTSGRRRRDSMGRYADDRYSGRRGYSRDEAKDKLIGEMEGMMDDVSPEAQHAIEKAIHALHQE